MGSEKQKSVSVDRVKDFAKTLKKGKIQKHLKNSTNVDNNKNVNKQEEEKKDPIDPVDNLTVANLQEVLRSRGLKVSGNKKELQERLRSEIQSMLDNNDKVFDE